MWSLLPTAESMDMISSEGWLNEQILKNHTEPAYFLFPKEYKTKVELTL
jgi:hypothetical protein